MDLLDRINNQQHEAIITAKSRDEVVVFRLDSTPTASIELKCSNFSRRVDTIHCPLVVDFVEEGASDLHLPFDEDVVEKSVEILSRFWQVVDEDMPETVTLFSCYPTTHLPSNVVDWLKEELMDEDEPKWDNIREFCNACHIANYLGCTSFLAYFFCYLYVLTISMSREQREQELGHPYFGLPVGGWDHPLTNFYRYSFLTEEEMAECTEQKYKKFLVCRQVL